MEIIKSRKNKVIVDTLNIKKEPKDALFLENIKLINEAISCGCSLRYTLISGKKEEYYLKNFPLLFNYDYYIVSEDIINYLSDTKSPQGIIGVIDLKGLKNEINLNENFIVLESIQDPGNLGTIIRSASGTSFTNIFLINCVDIFNQKVIRSSMGGIFKVKTKKFASDNDFLDFANRNKLKYMVASMEGENIFKIKSKLPQIGVAIGNEGSGVSKNIKENATKIISIPMKNNLESLNAAVSCSILIYYLDALSN